MTIYPGEPIKAGSSNATVVRLVQRRLKVGETGAFDERTRRALEAFQSHAGLAVDAIVGPKTWVALFPPNLEPVSDLADKALALAAGEVGTEEDPRGSNKGNRVEEYLGSVGLGGGYAWCAAFVFWCFREASKASGAKNPLVRTAGVVEHWRRAEQVTRLYPTYAADHTELLQPGIIFCMEFGHGTGHTGLVESFDGLHSVNTIEGNTNDDGSREGYAVARRKRKVSSINLGFLRYA